jgi:hypothetical protein
MPSALWLNRGLAKYLADLPLPLADWPERPRAKGGRERKYFVDLFVERDLGPDEWSEVCRRCREIVPLEDSMDRVFCDSCFRVRTNTLTGVQLTLDLDGIHARLAKHREQLFRKAVAELRRKQRNFCGDCGKNIGEKSKRCASCSRREYVRRQQEARAERRAD